MMRFTQPVVGAGATGASDTDEGSEFELVDYAAVVGPADAVPQDVASCKDSSDAESHAADDLLTAPLAPRRSPSPQQLLAVAEPAAEAASAAGLPAAAVVEQGLSGQLDADSTTDSTHLEAVGAAVDAASEGAPTEAGSSNCAATAAARAAAAPAASSPVSMVDSTTAAMQAQEQARERSPTPAAAPEAAPAVPSAAEPEQVMPEVTTSPLHIPPASDDAAASSGSRGDAADGVSGMPVQHTPTSAAPAPPPPPAAAAPPPPTAAAPPVPDDGAAAGGSSAGTASRGLLSDNSSGSGNSSSSNVRRASRAMRVRPSTMEQWQQFLWAPTCTILRCLVVLVGMVISMHNRYRTHSLYSTDGVRLPAWLHFSVRAGQLGFQALWLFSCLLVGLPLLVAEVTDLVEDITDGQGIQGLPQPVQRLLWPAWAVRLRQRALAMPWLVAARQATGRVCTAARSLLMDPHTFCVLLSRLLQWYTLALIFWGNVWWNPHTPQLCEVVLPAPVAPGSNTSVAMQSWVRMAVLVDPTQHDCGSLQQAMEQLHAATVADLPAPSIPALARDVSHPGCVGCDVPGSGSTSSGGSSTASRQASEHHGTHDSQHHNEHHDGRCEHHAEHHAECAEHHTGRAKHHASHHEAHHKHHDAAAGQHATTQRSQDGTCMEHCAAPAAAASSGGHAQQQQQTGIADAGRVSLEPGRMVPARVRDSWRLLVQQPRKQPPAHDAGSGSPEAVATPTGAHGAARAAQSDSDGALPAAAPAGSASAAAAAVGAAAPAAGATQAVWLGGADAAAPAAVDPAMYVAAVAGRQPAAAAAAAAAATAVRHVSDAAHAADVDATAGKPQLVQAGPRSTSPCSTDKARSTGHSAATSSPETTSASKAIGSRLHSWSARLSSSLVQGANVLHTALEQLDVEASQRAHALAEKATAQGGVLLHSWADAQAAAQQYVAGAARAAADKVRGAAQATWRFVEDATSPTTAAEPAAAASTKQLDSMSASSGDSAAHMKHQGMEVQLAAAGVPGRAAEEGAQGAAPAQAASRAGKAPDAELPPGAHFMQQVHARAAQLADGMAGLHARVRKRLPSAHEVQEGWQSTSGSAVSAASAVRQRTQQQLQALREAAQAKVARIRGQGRAKEAGQMLRGLAGKVDEAASNLMERYEEAALQLQQDGAAAVQQARQGTVRAVKQLHAQLKQLKKATKHVLQPAVKRLARARQQDSKQRRHA